MAKTYNKPTHPRFKDITGEKFNRLRVLDYQGIDRCNNQLWLVYCDPILGGCGKTKVVQAGMLKNGKIQSCGCLRLEHVTKHGHYHHRFYAIHKQMMARCYNPKNISYSRYGGRGIYVVQEWHDISTFLLWADSNQKPRGPKKTLERKDNDGPYSPENCCWATSREQANNTRKNTWLTFNGKTQTNAEWARELNLPVVTLWNRLHRLNWSVEKALATPRRTC